MSVNAGLGRRKDDELTRLYPGRPGETLPAYSNGRTPVGSGTEPRFVGLALLSICENWGSRETV